jgi:hypothetical protein
VRFLALSRLGGCCQGCGETNPNCLVIDHVHGDGAEERRRMAKSTLYLKIARGTVQDLDRYQCLCANCNLIKAHRDGELRKGRADFA